jgi:uncharacterized membrane protein
MKRFKGVIAGVLSALISSPLLPEHPMLYALAIVLLAVIILVFWTGVISIRRS